MKLRGEGSNANSENWFDFEIRPNYERNDRYIFSIVYRNRSKEATQESILNIEEQVRKIAELIDG